MRLMMFEKGRGAALGLVEGKSVIDLAAVEASLPKDLKSLIAAGPSALDGVKAAAGKAPEAAKLGLDRVKAALPIWPAGKIVCVGLNYALHAKEGGQDLSVLLPAGADLARGRGRTGDPAQMFRAAR